jgi:broad specificity phosphatase PhoE
MAGKLVLVRHSAPLIEEGVPQSRWRLSEKGREAAMVLAGRLLAFDAPAIWTSTERKALETAEVLAAALGLPIREEPDLREHERASLGYMARAEREAGVERLLASDDELVFGDETARSVLDRMDRALHAAMVAAAGSDVLAVTHGTAAAIFVGRRCGVDALAFWRALGVPAAIVLDGDRIEEIVQ